MNSRITHIRNEERKYHETLYDNFDLFEAGSWLHKPVKTVLDTLEYFDKTNPLMVLDLGCGVGRNSIPIARFLKETTGKVVCVDIFESALIRLKENSKLFEVSEQIVTKLSDIGDYVIDYYSFAKLIN